MEWEETPPKMKALIKGASEPFRVGADTAREAILKNTFMRIWFQYDQGQKFLTNWHHAYVAQVYYDVLTGKRKNVVVNQPPGSSKSEAWCVFLPALASVNFDRVRILTLSYSKALVDEHANRVKGLLGGSEFQELWPRKFGRTNSENFTLLDDTNKVTFQAFARSMEGQITGVRAGYMVDGYTGHIMIDDPQKPVDMLSELKRNKSNQVLSSTIRSRRARPDTPVIIVQQRLHTNDASGFVLSGGLGMDFDHINIPALIDRDYIESLPDDIRALCWESIKDSPSRVVAGTEYWSYWPDKEDVDDLISLWESDEYTFVSQYQQHPQALTGGLIDTSWFQTYTELPPLTHRAIYVDTNSGKVKDYNDYTVFTLVGRCKAGNLYIIDVSRGKWDPEDLLQQAEMLWEKWKPYNFKRPMPLRSMYIEDKQAGQGLITTLQKRGRIPVTPVQRGNGQDKLVRALNVIPQIKTGKVYVPSTDVAEVHYWDDTVAARTDWVMYALKEAADFTADDSHDYDDVLDTWLDAIQTELVDGTGGGFASML